MYLLILPQLYFLICNYITKFLYDINSCHNNQIQYANQITEDSNSCVELKLSYLQGNQDNFLYILKYKTNDILLFSDLLYSYYSFIFLLIGLILLTAMLGSIILALSTIEDTI